MSFQLQASCQMALHLIFSHSGKPLGRCVLFSSIGREPIRALHHVSLHVPAPDRAFHHVFSSRREPIMVLLHVSSHVGAPQRAFHQIFFTSLVHFIMFSPLMGHPRQMFYPPLVHPKGLFYSIFDMLAPGYRCTLYSPSDCTIPSSTQFQDILRGYLDTIQSLS